MIPPNAIARDFFIMISPFQALMQSSWFHMSKSERDPALTI
jgi:hypothetical protein